MPCYSYSANSVINFVGNVEKTYVFNGPGNYSFSTLQWICEFPLTEQLRVYGQTGLGATSETELIQGTDFTIDSVNQNIVVTTSPAITVLIIRRTTPSNKMIYKFVDGAKLTARELNASFHQLLFLNQEKDFTNGTNHYNYYPIFSSISAWVNGNSYTPGNFVSFGGSVYLCKVATNSELPTNTSFWTNVNTNSSHLIVTSGPNPLSINLTNLSIGKALVWNGSEFTAQSFTSSLSTLTDVNLTGIASGDLLRYNGTQWIKATPSIQDITASNLVLNNRAFYGLATTLSYTNNATSIDVSSKTFLLPFKSGTNWVLTDPPTVYHIVKNSLPNSADPETFFTQIRNELDGLSANVTNPVKLKLFWDLNADRVNVADTAGTGDNLDNYKAYFWDSYGELYNVTGYGTTAGIKYHGVDDGTHLHKVSPYFYEKRLKSNGSLVSFTSKLKGYGIKHFYLSVPECYSTPLADIPAAASSSTYFTSTTNASLITSLNAIGGDNEAGFPQRDLYLMGLRDMAFAAARPTPGGTDLAGSVVKNRDAKVRYYKGAVLIATYTNLDDANFMRFEDPNDTPRLVLWKIPRQMIYYNKVALAFTNKDSAVFNSNSTPNGNTTRFQGYNAFQGDYTNAGTFPFHNSSSSGLGLGTLFKANHYWASWCQKWDSDAGTVTENYRYNEADIDWFMYNMVDGASNIGLYKTVARCPPLISSTSNFVGAGNELSYMGKYYFPWSFRPNDPRVDVSDSVGTLLFNIDANKLFSEATNFLPDPEDEYVFRLVASDSLTSIFSTAGFNTLKTAVILEYGFNESSNFSKTTPYDDTNLAALFPQGSYATDRYRADSRIDYSKIRVFIKKENLETTGTGASQKTRYVITLGIRVPRIKSIGYAKVFRRMAIGGTVTTYPQRDAVTSDTETDSGPWSWGAISPLTYAHWDTDRLIKYPMTTVGATGFSSFNVPTLSGYTSTALSGASSIFTKLENASWGPYATLSRQNTQSGTSTVPINSPEGNWVSGRNECAVKFTRVGIPSTLWIRLSVLNTDGSTSLLDSSGFINVTG